jgi:hypothetical protein
MKWCRVSPQDFDASFEMKALIAEFGDDSDEAAYEGKDAFLIELIKYKCKSELGEALEEHTYHLYDWWPNHTRYIGVSADYCTPTLILALQGLLADEFSDYRIQVIVHEDLRGNGEDETGALCVYSDSVIVEHKVAERCSLPYE